MNLCGYGESFKRQAQKIMFLKHRENQTFNTHSENIAFLQNKVNKLMVYKDYSKANTKYLEKKNEVSYLKERL